MHPAIQWRLRPKSGCGLDASYRSVLTAICEAGGSSLSDSLMSLSMASIPNSIVKVDREWWSSGAETFAVVFSVVSPGQSYAPRYILKSSISLGSKPSDVVQSWVGRRADLQSNEVQTPQLMFYGRGDVCEEYIQYSLPEAFAATKDRANFVANVGRTISRIHESGFRPLTLRDARSRGEDCVIIDYGSDLGSASFRPAPASGLGADRLAREMLSTR